MKKITFLACLLFMGKMVLAQQFKVGTEVNEYPAVQWIKGEPVAKFDPSKIYIVECWATWCGPCLAAMPHLSELHKKFGNKVIIIGQNVSEKDMDKVKKFVVNKGDEMGYRAAFSGDNDSDFMKKWFVPAGIPGIPATIIIKNNRVAWITHPTMLTDAVVEYLLTANFTPESAMKIRESDDAYMLMEYYRTGKYDEALKVAENVLAKTPEDNTALVLKVEILKKTGRQNDAAEFLKGLYTKKYNSGIATMYYKLFMTAEQYDEVIRLVNNDLKRTADTGTSRYDIISTGYLAYMKNNEPEKAMAFLQEILKGKRQDDMLAISTLPMNSRSLVSTKEQQELFTATSKAYLKQYGISVLHLLRMVDYYIDKKEVPVATAMVDQYLEKYQGKTKDEALIAKLDGLSRRLHKGEIPTGKELQAIGDTEN